RLASPRSLPSFSQGRATAQRLVSFPAASPPRRRCQPVARQRLSECAKSIESAMVRGRNREFTGAGGCSGRGVRRLAAVSRGERLAQAQRAQIGPHTAHIVETLLL